MQATKRCTANTFTMKACERCWRRDNTIGNVFQNIIQLWQSCLIKKVGTRYQIPSVSHSNSPRRRIKRFLTRISAHIPIGNFISVLLFYAVLLFTVLFFIDLLIILRLYCQHVEPQFDSQKDEILYFLKRRKNDPNFQMQNLKHSFSPIPPTLQEKPYHCKLT